MLASQDHRPQSSSPDYEHDAGAFGASAPSPEQRLFVALLRRAVWDYVLYKASTERDKKAISNDAAEWIFADDEEDIGEEGHVSFVYACAVLNVDPGMVRRATSALKRDDIHRLSNNLQDV